jgi:hypothetical protein
MGGRKGFAERYRGDTVGFAFKLPDGVGCLRCRKSSSVRSMHFAESWNLYGAYYMNYDVNETFPKRQLFPS